MKLLMTCDAVGGVWQYATDLADELAEQGVDVVLAVIGPPSPLPPSRERDRRGTRQGEGQLHAPESGRRAGRTVTHIHTNLSLDWLACGPDEVLHSAHAIADLAREHRADVIHLNSPTLAAIAHPAPVVAVAHGCVGTWWAAAHGTAPDAQYIWHGDLMRAGLLAANAVVAPSASYAATLQRHYALPATPLAIHNGRTPHETPERAEADHVLTAGRLWDRVKNADLLDQVAALLPVPLRAAGPTVAPHGETVTPRHLHLLGTLDETALAVEYAARPIFISAASFEPFGLAVLEAAQAGCPLILSGIDTFRELWSGAALIVPDQDARAYAAAVARVRTEPGLREHLSTAAQARAVRYTPQATAAAMLDLYHSLLTQQRAAA